MLRGSELWLLRLMADRGRSVADASAVLVLVEERGELRVAAASGAGSARVRIVPLQGAVGELYAAGRPVSVDRPRGPDAAWLYELGLEVRAALAEPFAMEGQGRGMVIAAKTEGSFRDADRQAFAAFAKSVGERLAAERSVEIERLRYGMEARERERTRWAREIHDESIQGIGALRLRLANARDLDDPTQLRAAVDAALEGLGTEIDGLRHLITELRPAALDDLGLAAALEALARRAQAVDGLEVETVIALDGAPPRSREHDVEHDGEGPRLDPELESTVYRIVQEALTNVGRHAQATRAEIGVRIAGEKLIASVADDGRGMPNADRLGPRGDGLEGGFGMGGMRERAELVGGELIYEAAPGGGTIVRLTVPLAGRAVRAPEAQTVR